MFAKISWRDRSDNEIDLNDYKLPYQNIDITNSKIMPSKSALVLCTRSNTSLVNFNTFYGTNLTEDRYMTLPLANEVLQTATIYATISPITASNKAMTWTSSDTSIAAVSSSGVITAKSQGVAVITAKTVYGGYTATCQVTYQAKLIIPILLQV